MAPKDQPTVIKKYANRRLYHTGTSTYVTLDDLAEMVKRGDEFTVFDAKSGDDITRSVLTQIIFEQEGKGGQNLLPIAFLRQLISYYGDSMQALVPSYLDYSIKALADNQQKFRDQISNAFGVAPFGMMEEHVQKNMVMFRDAMAMFAPFGVPGPLSTEPTPTDGAAGETKPASATPTSAPDANDDISVLKRELANMQKRLDKIGR